MALLHINFKSKYLGGNTDVSVLLPGAPYYAEPKEFYKPGERYPVLWLLHGTGDDHTSWLRSSNIERYVEGKKLAVVMPTAMNTDYLNWPNFGMGYRAYDYFWEELMPALAAWLPLSTRREDNYIAGLSMGGRGVCTYAFSHPERFAGAAVLSAAPRDVRHGAHSPWPERDANLVANAGGLEAFLASPANTWDLVREQLEKGVELPKLYFLCGTADPIAYNDFCNFRSYAQQIGLAAAFETMEGEGHSWNVWDTGVRRAMEYFGL